MNKTAVGDQGLSAVGTPFLALDPARRTAYAMVFNTSIGDGPDPGERELAALLEAAERLLE